jgi:hypothetical protein
MDGYPTGIPPKGPTCLRLYEYEYLVSDSGEKLEQR